MTARIGVRLDDDLRERLTAVAQARVVDCSTLIREALEAYLAAHDAPTPLAADTPPAHGHTADDCVSTLGAPQTSVTSDPCACCGEPACSCAAEDWCARCFRCIMHCPCAGDLARAQGYVVPQILQGQ